MKKTTKLLFAGALIAAASAPLAASAAVNVDVSIGFPGYSTYVVPAPSYYYPPAVVYSRPYVVHRDYYRDRHHEWERHHRFDDRRHW